MCSHYHGVKDQERFRRHFGAAAPAEAGREDLWPGYAGSFIRCHPLAHTGDEAVPALEALTGLFGLVPHWSAGTKIARHTYNARSETVAVKPSFRDAWKHGQHCIIPADAFFEPDWRSGRAVATRIASAEGEPLGIAGLWAHWRSPQGDLVYSYTMLTINADTHPLMQQFHKPGEEKRMVVILEPQHYQGWLTASAADARGFLLAYADQRLQTAAGPAH